MVIRKTLTVRIALAAALSIAPAFIGAQQPAGRPTPAPASGSDPQFKVRLDFNRWHDHAELKSDFQRLEKAWPKFLKYLVARPEPRQARDHDGHGQQPRHGSRDREARDVHRSQRPWERNPGSRSCAVHRLVPDGELRTYRSHHQARQRTRLLRRPDRQSRRPGSLPERDRSGVAHRACTGGRRQRRHRGRGWRRRPERQWRHRADPEVRARAGNAPQERGGRQAPQSGAGGRGGRLRHPWQRGHRQRWRRPGQRGSGRRLRREPQLGLQLAAELHPERLDGLPVSAARGEGGQRLPDDAPERRRRAVVSQQRRDDPPWSRRRMARRVSAP